MRTLRTLSDTDKHRVIVPALFFPLLIHANVEPEGARRLEHIRRLEPGRKMRLGTELSTWTLSAKPKNVRVEYKITCSPAFPPSLIRPSPGNSIEDVGGTLTTIAAICTEILDHFDL